MASNTTTPPSEAPLGFMTKLCPEAYHYRPPPTDAPALRISTASGSPTPPRMILFFSWMGARDIHIAKYLRPYQAMYPSAEILLIRCDLLHFMRPAKTLSDIKQFAVPIIRAAYPPSSSSTNEDPKQTQPQLLVHLFSGGGSYMLALLRTALAPTMPPHTLVMDSAPPQFRYWGSYLAATGGWSTWSKRLLGPFVHLLCAWWWVNHRIFNARGGGQLGRVAAIHNEREGRANSEVRRAYIYGPGDKLVRCEDVEWHAADARSKGFQVRLERFEGTVHVAHVRGDGQRYWRITKETWEGGADS
ncbi:transmembrane protein 53 [Echria macrotheca]|uniref:Transmembrane protein 53 n=1 Tax=Echria macrotheca TaxID=438768 RepID=A0AAJ0B4N3_9PEZI|nr:transmembrane protein 53 [Echria macrotheca]